MLLTADWHLTAKPEDEYRWDIFARLRELTRDENREHEIVMLGDMTDHKTDKHPAALVNRLVSAILDLVEHRNTTLTIIMGNHDAPLNGVPYWDFLNNLPNVHYFSVPTKHSDCLFLPFSKAPKWDWRDIDFKTYKAVFMHQPVAGADIGNGRKIKDEGTVRFPRSCRVYSGDIHTPQTIGNVTYVGAPHWVRFGDTHARRILDVDDTTYKIQREIFLDTGSRKLILNVGSIEELEALGVKAGDQVRVRFSLAAHTVADAPRIADAIQQWAARNNIALVSTETTMEGDERYANTGDFLHDPADVLHAFVAYEGITDEIARRGAALMSEVFPSNKDGLRNA